MESSKNGEFTDECEEAAIKIQAVFRGHRSRQGLVKQSSEEETKSMVVIVIAIRLSKATSYITYNMQNLSNLI